MYQKLARAALIQAFEDRGICPIDILAGCSDELFIQFNQLGLFARPIFGIFCRVDQENLFVIVDQCFDRFWC